MAALAGATARPVRQDAHTLGATRGCRGMLYWPKAGARRRGADDQFTTGSCSQHLGEHVGRCGRAPQAGRGLFGPDRREAESARSAQAGRRKSQRRRWLRTGGVSHAPGCMVRCFGVHAGSLGRRGCMARVAATGDPRYVPEAESRERGRPSAHRTATVRIPNMGGDTENQDAPRQWSLGIHDGRHAGLATLAARTRASIEVARHRWQYTPLVFLDCSYGRAVHAMAGGESGCKRGAGAGCEHGVRHVSRKPACSRAWGGCATKAR